MRKTLVLLLVAGGLFALMRAGAQEAPKSAAAMSAAAVKFLEQLTPAQREQATFDFDEKSAGEFQGPERLNWHFIPRPRQGLPLKSLEGAPLKAAHEMIASGLSPAGYDQTLNVMSLEEILYLIEEGERNFRRDRRDPQKYYLSIFGQPGNSGTWGWRLEGHHISLNYLIKDGQVVSSTPEFFGANPGLVEAGPGRMIRVLGPEEDIARQILKLCNEDQNKKAYINAKAPEEIRDPNKTQATAEPAIGLKAGEMSPDQRRLLTDLINEYLKNMPADVSETRRKELEAAGIDAIAFAWWGGRERNEPHYYRVQGPTFLIEYNNVQNNANHVHSVWRNMRGDFGISR